MKNLYHLTTWFGPHIIELMLDAEAWFKDAMGTANFNSDLENVKGNKVKNGQ